MASIERTAYPRFPRLLTTLDLQRFFSPAPEELGWVDKPARGQSQRLALMVQLKCFQYLTIETAYGRLDRAALTQARESYDTAGLLRTVSELDQWIEGVQGEDGLADMLLRLHSMARTVINDAPMDVAAGDETLPDLALDLIMGPRRGHCQAARVGRAHRAA